MESCGWVEMLEQQVEQFAGADSVSSSGLNHNTSFIPRKGPRRTKGQRSAPSLGPQFELVD